MVIEYCRPSWPGKHSPTPWKAQKTQKRFLTPLFSCHPIGECLPAGLLRNFLPQGVPVNPAHTLRMPDATLTPWGKGCADRTDRSAI